jgi:hypothetical protein
MHGCKGGENDRHVSRLQLLAKKNVAKYEVEADLHCSVFQFTMQVKQLLGKDQ